MVYARPPEQLADLPGYRAVVLGRLFAGKIGKTAVGDGGSSDVR